MSPLFVISLWIGGALGSSQISPRVPDQRVVIAKAFTDVVNNLGYHRHIPNPSKLANVIKESDLDIFNNIESVFTDALISHATHEEFPSGDQSDTSFSERIQDVLTMLNALIRSKYFQSRGQMVRAASDYASAIEHYKTKLSIDHLYPERPLWF